MKELWDEKGYGHLEVTSQNFRDQASRLEKIELDERARVRDSDTNINRTSYIAAAHDFGSSQEFSESGNHNIIGHSSKNANSSLPPSNFDLHMLGP